MGETELLKMRINSNKIQKNSDLFQADKERAARQREFLAQLERKAAGFDESSEPTSMTNSSTVEGEHTIQGHDDVDDDEQTLDGVQEVGEQYEEYWVRLSC